MKEKILNLLMLNTELVEKSSGGNDPIVIAFRFSDDQDKEQFLSQIATEIEQIINPTINT